MSNLFNDQDGVFADNISERERIDRCSLIASNYEQEVNKKDYTAPYTTAGAIGEVYPDGRDTKEILDIAAGTGLVAVELKKLGFRVMDALEPAAEMLELASKKGLYRNLYSMALTAEPLLLPSDTYDAISICGWHGNASSLADALPEIIRITKPGGYILIVTRMHYVKTLDDYKATFLTQCGKLEADGKWKQVEFAGFPGYLSDVEGVKMGFTVC